MACDTTDFIRIDALVLLVQAFSSRDSFPTPMAFQSTRRLRPHVEPWVTYDTSLIQPMVHL